ncbi:MAG: hypothetical protein MJ177_08130, partial [Clostridia bacterium]|nr:hypothetical protein [Clostridia bacterium]
YGKHPAISSFALVNQSGGKIISCVSHSNLYAKQTYDSHCGGIAYDNKGTIVDCEADGTLLGDHTSGNSGNHSGGIACYNSGNIQMSTYTGSSSVPLVYENFGVIVQ